MRALQAGSLEPSVGWAGCRWGLRGARCRQRPGRVQTHLLTPVFQIILVSSSLSDRDQSLFLSADEGATFQKQVVPFSVETLIFHPREEDKLLAYTKEGKVSHPGEARRTGSLPITQDLGALGCRRAPQDWGQDPITPCSLGLGLGLGTPSPPAPRG